MKFAYSTIACHEWSLNHIIEKTNEWGFDGVEIRGISGEMDIIKLPEFSLKNVNETKQKFTDAGIEPAFIATSCKYHFPDKTEREQQIERTRKYIELAAALGLGSIRILGDRIPDDMTRQQVVPYIADAMHIIGEFAGEYGIRLLVETHGDFVHSHHLTELINKSDSEQIGVLWDMHNTYRVANEAPAESWKLLGNRVGYTHIKDSQPYPNRFGFRYRLLGEGDVPYQEMLKVLHSAGYQGYVSTEWERLWMPELEPPDIVMPHYLKVLKKAVAKL